MFVDKRFINKAQFDAGFAHRLILKDGVVPAIKDPGHDSELQMVSETASNVSVLYAIGASTRHSLAPPTDPLSINKISGSQVSFIQVRSLFPV